MTTTTQPHAPAAVPLFELDAPLPSHPAKYTDALLLTMARMLQGRKRILDPFGGTGKVFLLNHWLHDAQIEAIELEPEFIRNPRTRVGNALCLQWGDDCFDAICTSPTYGNRMADTLLDDDKYTRMTYTAKLNRPLHPDNSGQLQWGDEYKNFHGRAWWEARRVLAEDGALVLNIKDHVRDGRRQYVTDWHIGCLEGIGFQMIRHKKIDTPSYRHGANWEARIPYESVILFQLGSKS